MNIEKWLKKSLYLFFALATLGLTLDISYLWYQKNVTTDSTKVFQSQMASLETIEAEFKNIEIQKSILEPSNQRALSAITQLSASSSLSEVASQLNKISQRAKASSSLVINEVFTGLDKIQSILIQRNYELRHNIASLRLVFREMAERAVINDDSFLLQPYISDLKRFEKLVDQANIRDDFKETILDELGKMQVSLKWVGYESRYAQLGIDQIASWQKEFNIAKQGLQAQKNAIPMSWGSIADKLMFRLDFYPIIFAIFSLGLMFLLGSLAGKKLSLNAAVKKQFKKKVKDLKQREKVLGVVKSATPLAQALVGPNGAIKWSTCAFDSLLGGEISVGRGWNYIEQNMLISTSYETGIENTFSLRGALNKDLIVKKTNVKYQQELTLVSVFSLHDYYLDFELSKSRRKYEKRPSFVIEDAIEASLVSFYNKGVLVDVDLGYTDNTPRTFNGEQRVLEKVVTVMAQSLTQADFLYGKQGLELEIDYTKNQDELNLILRLKGVKLDSHLVSFPYTKKGNFASLIDSFEHLESTFADYRCTISTTNIYGQNKHQTKFAEIIVSLKELPVVAKKSQPKSLTVKKQQPKTRNQSVSKIRGRQRPTMEM